MKKRATTSTESPDRLNVIVKGSKVIGDMITDSNLRIDGEVQGNVSAASKVVIGKSGLIKGNLTCGSADIEGKIEGVIKVEELLSLRETAKIEGEITTSKLQIEEGAIFSGNCIMSNHKGNTEKPAILRPEQDNVVY
ncbi:polymer-forming cytoskeletal protein [Crocinitomicaceae bacterium]|nr:polymer-forming cytoskeletal protein [Crocinitomicaceae bacterium]